MAALKITSCLLKSECIRRSSVVGFRKMSSLICDQAYINGAWVGAQSGKTYQVTNPVDGSVLGQVPHMDSTDTKVAIQAAHDAFQTWRETTPKERSAFLRKWFDAMMKNNEELATILTSEQGKPLAESRGEVAFGASFLEWYAEEARRLYGETNVGATNTKQMVFIREPIGVAAMITPWNFPSAMITRKIGAALAAGCTCVLRPAEDTPLSALALVKLADDVGIPKGVVNVVTSGGENADEIGKALCESPLVAGLSFTGSTRVGKLLYRQCAGTVKKLSLELGGNAPFIVFESADLDQAIAGCMASKFRNMGQTCVTTNRVLVQDTIYDAFVAKLKEAIQKSMVLGNGLHQGVNQGPLINKRQFDRVVSLVNDAVEKGANVVIGGEKDNFGELYYKPTILTDLTPDMAVCKEEIFGPVTAIAKFKTEEEALAIANDCRVGLAGYFYSNDVRQCWRVAKKMETGMVGVNDALISAVEAPFGGVKESGLGREGSRHGIDDYTDIKYICFGNL